MKSVRTVPAAVLPAVAMAVLILDAKTALAGALSGLELCIRVVIPSLYPFLFLSVMVTGQLTGSHIPLLRPLGVLCRIPRGAESLLAVGLLGGYPVGAQCIAQAYRSGRLSRDTAHRMMGFCSNAGPSFLFGMLAGVFEPSALWVLWGIHILSAILTGMLLPGGRSEAVDHAHSTAPSPAQALEKSIRVMANICGWVIIFRVLLTFCQQWFLWLLPEGVGILVSGLLELTNGCCRLSLLPTLGERFVFASLLLGCGGICVGLQTVSVTAGLGTGLYVPGKLLQGCISFLLSWTVQFLLFPADQQWMTSPLPLLVFAIAAVVFTVLQFVKIHGSNLARQGV